jgi:metal-sulfur cluster biosynthetic enzyme
VSDDTTKTDTPVHAAWTPEGEVKPPAQAVTEDAVIGAISTVFDPEIPVDIYELGLIYKIDIADDRSVKIDMSLTSPNCPSRRGKPWN